MRTKIDALIIEDELHASKNLVSMLEKHCPEVNVMAEINNPAEAFTWALEHKPELVFLDVEMPGQDGFEFLASFKNQIPFKVIFVTAFDHYALRAIRQNALDFLLKPIDSKELVRAIKKAGDQLFSSHQPRYTSLINTLEKPIDKRNKIAISSSKGLDLVSVKDIIYCEAQKEYTFIHLTDNRQILSSTNIGEYEFLLEGYDFFRVHHSYLVQFPFIEKYLKGEGGSIIMTSGAEITVSRRRKTEFLEWLTR
jgi:two-component system, LytTR family, response regulator